MPLSIQIYSLLFSLVFGIFFFIMLEINSRFIYDCNIIVKLVFTFLFVLFITFLYFICLLKINNGIVHIYFLLMVLVGYLVSYVIYYKYYVK